MTLEEFVTQRVPGLLRYATTLTCDPHLAEDIVQEVLLRAQRRWRRIGAMDPPDHYVRRMITNEYLSQRRRKAFHDVRVAPDSMADYGPSLADGTAAYDERDEMLARLRELPPRQRTALALRYYCGLSDDEIAHTMRCRPGTVRGHMSRAHATLRALTEPTGAPR
ncbi:SigE family RNA polymerase sigma factor [Actinokineospora sp. HUAS TT18]|uniref:SigE family RNA polymerase sigma factor n=1 Tax=Actinokineospora sp. HUAS TT18 TaxID=3447451 RepID=UPI003F51C77A